jgi:hypothetical protein
MISYDEASEGLKKLAWLVMGHAPFADIKRYVKYPHPEMLEASQLAHDEGRAALRSLLEDQRQELEAMGVPEPWPIPWRRRKRRAKSAEPTAPTQQQPLSLIAVISSRAPTSKPSAATASAPEERTPTTRGTRHHG